MMMARITYWKERDGRFLGFLNDYPDHWTQGEDIEDLREHLRDLHRTFTSENIPGIRNIVRKHAAGKCGAGILPACQENHGHHLGGIREIPNDDVIHERDDMENGGGQNARATMAAALLNGYG